MTSSIFHQVVLLRSSQDGSDDKAMRSASYVVNGLEKVFRAILNARHWETGLFPDRAR